MEFTGFSYEYLIILLCNLFLLGGWAVFSLITLFFPSEKKIEGIDTGCLGAHRPGDSHARRFGILDRQAR